MKLFSKEYFKRLWKVILATFSGFSDDNGLKLSASLAYYTIFSLAPLLLLILSLAGIFLKDQSYRQDFYAQVQQYIGKAGTLQLQSTIQSQDITGKSGIGLAISIVTLLLGASSIFVEIQDSLNTIWRVKAKPKKGWVKMLKNRFLSFSLIVSLGFLLLASLLVNIIISALSDKLVAYLPRLLGKDIAGVVGETFIFSVNLAITLLVISVLFSIIFKVLPDVKIKWSDVRSGAIFTAILFILGQYIISLYIQYTAQGSAYGTAGSIIVILVWIYYTAAILYIGAEFTQVYAEAKGSHIEPADYAVVIQQTEVERKLHTVPLQNPELHGVLKCDDDDDKKK
ncbi:MULTISPECIES: YihY/virulence factor BrkB family protein [unclassified Mucilaginibacter]|uniref:YihY/virulence factor BrkB family protein n=1 Tax=unclassified Mucilaginibacter TaxID=2617802 RepID=UPI000963775C|nr:MULTISPECIES: YihY/virulence factor BrkB family protein [unclassified Mucilaginibacter]OJW17325.1 MAG: ribonuclease BN [Mucilaginibacter sp. 44-25]PLW91620.1 MAG: ribonuclease BN [Mucilaginibacter sp.]PMP65828.1 MAG: ribonuclease BN [Mucilaginibacter sp.]HEK18871.1 YihY/virulence factor BrkB family protein [Bacteroidota bacterium]